MAENIFTWCGHSAFRVETTEGRTLYIDPFLSANPSCPPELRRVERCDIIAITHGHADHLGDTYAIYGEHRPVVISIFDLCPLLQKNGVSPGDCIGMNIGGTVEVHGIKFMQTPAMHSGSAEDNGVSIYGGAPTGYVVELEDGFRFYHSGDTWVMKDMELIGELFRPQVAMLPIGGHFTMDPAAAALAAKMLRVDSVIPMHFATFPILMGDPAELAEKLDGSGIKVMDVQLGLPFSLP